MKDNKEKTECCVNCKGVRFPGGVCVNPSCPVCHSPTAVEGKIQAGEGY